MTRQVACSAWTIPPDDRRRCGREDIPDTSKVTVTAQAFAAKRNDAALEQIVGRLSLEPSVTGATWEIDRTIAEA
jgi:putative Mg2+ transporter-C (MgtC) family protein